MTGGVYRGVEIVCGLYPCRRPFRFAVREGCELLLAVVGKVLNGGQWDISSSAATPAGEKAPCEKREDEDDDRAGNDGDDDDGRGGEA